VRTSIVHGHELAAGPTAAQALNWATAAGDCHRAAEWMHTHKVAALAQLRAGRPAEQIANAAHETADLIVLARSRRAGLLDRSEYVSHSPAVPAMSGVSPRRGFWHVPATFADVVRLARVPILVVPAHRGTAVRARDSSAAAVSAA